MLPKGYFEINWPLLYTNMNIEFCLTWNQPHHFWTKFWISAHIPFSYVLDNLYWPFVKILRSNQFTLSRLSFYLFWSLKLIKTISYIYPSFSDWSTQRNLGRTYQLVLCNVFGLREVSQYYRRHIFHGRTLHWNRKLYYVSRISVHIPKSYLAHRIQQPISKLRVLIFHDGKQVKLILMSIVV